MTPAEHDDYAQDLLSSLSDDHPESELVNFDPDRTMSRNAARAMTAILCKRLLKSSQHPPVKRKSQTFEWRVGTFNSRNIADRDYLWTNIRRNTANEIHNIAANRPVAYLLACPSPSDNKLCVWAIPEPLLYDSLSSLPPKAGGHEYTIQIRTDRQRIEHYAASLN